MTYYDIIEPMAKDQRHIVQFDAQAFGREYFTVHEFAEKMRVTERTVYRWIKLGLIQGMQVLKGGEYRIHNSELTRIQKQRR